MKIDCDVPCGIDPRAVRRVFTAAWQAAARNLGWNHKLPKRIWKVGTRKGNNPAWCPAMLSTPFVSLHIFINPRRSLSQNAGDLYDALGGRGGPTFDGDDLGPRPWPKAPKPTKRTKRELATVEKLAEARRHVAEWEQKRKEANRALRLAKTKLRRYKAQVRALERSVREKAPEESIGYDSKAFAAHMRERIGGAS